MTGQPAYTDAEWCTVADAYRDATGNVPREATVTAILDAVAPAIAARALREAADAITGDRGRWVNHSGPELTPREFDAAWLRARADKIEAGR